MQRAFMSTMIHVYSEYRISRFLRNNGRKIRVEYFIIHKTTIRLVLEFLQWGGSGFPSFGMQCCVVRQYERSPRPQNSSATCDQKHFESVGKCSL